MPFQMYTTLVMVTHWEISLWIFTLYLWQRILEDDWYSRIKRLYYLTSVQIYYSFRQYLYAKIEEHKNYYVRTEIIRLQGYKCWLSFFFCFRCCPFGTGISVCSSRKCPHRVSTDVQFNFREMRFSPQGTAGASYRFAIVASHC